jgi:hypothetical protein
MAIDTTKAQGNAPNTGAPGPTPAPTRPAAPTLATKQAATSYGQSGASFPSSVEPGAKVTSQLGLNIDRSGPAMDEILQRGHAAGLDSTGEWQTRNVDKTPFPPAHGMRSRTKGKE